MTTNRSEVLPFWERRVIIVASWKIMQKWLAH
jgi:hypothetical protein